MSMSSGRLRERRYFSAVADIVEADGYHHKVETPRFSCRAERLKNKQNYVVDAEEIYHSCELTFRIRQRSIDDTDIVEYNGERYRITSVDDYAEERQTTIILQKIND